MTLFEFLIKCPVCNSETKVIAYESNPLIFECGGCRKNVVMQGTNLYTVSNECVSKITKSHKTLPCGQVVSTKLSEEAKNVITKEKVDFIKAALYSSNDVNDFLNSI